MWIDLPGWQAQSSYVQPVAPPGTDPEAAPLVCLSFNQTWLPYVIGSLMQLVQPAAWATSDPTVLAGVLQDAQTLIQLFGAAEGCTMLTFQFTEACVLQFSLDGGVTWEDVAGWPTYAPACYVGPTGPTGPTGPAGGFDPGPPPIQPGQTTSELACAVAGYLAQYVIQVSLSAVVNAYNTSQTALEVATGILALIPGIDVVFAAVTGAVTVLYGAVNSGTIAAFTAAESDPLLLGDLTCAIYTATSGDGYVTASNFAAVQTAICGISYTYPAVISAICDWLAEMGYAGIAAAQIPGALAVVDCSACGTWCYEWDFTVSDGGWLIAGGQGAYAAGVGWQSSIVGGHSALYIYLPIAAHYLGEMKIVFETGSNSGGGRRAISCWHSGSNITGWVDVGDGTYPPSGHFGHIPVIDATIDELDCNLVSVGSTAPITVLSIEVAGTGANPFGANNCTY